MPDIVHPENRTPRSRPRHLALGCLLAGWCGVFTSGCSGTFWRPDFGGAMRLAGEQNRVVVVAYWSALNRNCARMEREVFSRQDVQESLAGTIPVRIDAFFNRKFGRDYGLDVLPSFVVFGPDGQVLRIRRGYMDEARFRGLLEACKLSL